MRVESITVEAFTIQDAFRSPGRGQLDPITVIIQHHGNRRATLTVECYGRAWNCFWGSMGSDSIAKFMGNNSADYIAGCLVRGTNGVVTNKRMRALDFMYVRDIAEAVIQAVVQRGQLHEVAIP